MSARATGERQGQPLVSVIVPAFNAQATLGRTLRSVSAQTYQRLEIIIVDDGSTDRTAEVAEEFCRSEPRARLIRKENGGLASARNRAIAEARGEWIAPIDADDLWHPSKIEKQVAAALAAPEAPGFVYCWRRLVDDDDRVIVSGLRWALEGAVFPQFAYVNAVECGSSILASRDAVLEAGGYDESLRAQAAQGCEDMLLQLKLARRYPVAAVPEHLVAWRLHDRNMSSDFEQMARSCQLVFRTLQAEGTPAPSQAVRWVGSRDAFDIAQSRATERRYAASLSSLGRAVWLDPSRTLLLLLYRAVRTVRRRLFRASSPHRHKFDAVDPAQETGRDPYEIVPLRRILDDLDRRRMARLATTAQVSTPASAPATVSS